MREIKFRAWDKKEKRMYHFNDYWIDNEHQSMAFMIAEPQSGLYCLDFDEHDLSEPMQYTGLKDKAGKEIYEGDILQMYFRNNQKAGTPFPVAWNDKHAAFTDWWPREGVEVIGNIYENPSLLD